MTPADALDIVVSRTGHARFRELCDPGHPDHQPGMAAVVLAMAAGPPPSARDATPAREPVPFARVHAAATSCPHRGPVVDSGPVPGCGCATVLCLSLVKVVGAVDCVACKATEMGVRTETDGDGAIAPG